MQINSHHHFLKVESASQQEQNLCWWQFHESPSLFPFLPALFSAKKGKYESKISACECRFSTCKNEYGINKLEPLFIRLFIPFRFCSSNTGTVKMAFFFSFFSFGR